MSRRSQKYNLTPSRQHKMKNPDYWMENLNEKAHFKNMLDSMKYEVQSCEQERQLIIFKLSTTNDLLLEKTQELNEASQTIEAQNTHIDQMESKTK